MRRLVGFGRRLVGPWGWRLWLLAAFAAAWAAWVVQPVSPLSEWTTTGVAPEGAFLTKDRSRLIGVRWRGPWAEMHSHPQFGPVRMWDLADGTERIHPSDDGRWSYGPARVWAAPDGSRLLIGRYFPGDKPDRFVDQWVCWESATGRERVLFPPSGQEKIPGIEFYGVFFSPTGNLMALPARAEGMRRPQTVTLVQDVATGEYIRTLDAAQVLAFSADGTVLVTEDFAQSEDKSEAARFVPGVGWETVKRPQPALYAVSLWDTATWQKRKTFAEGEWQPTAAALSRDGRRLAVALVPHGRPQPTVARLEVWDRDTGVKAVELEIAWPKDYVHRPIVAVSPDGSLLVTPAVDSARRHVWDLRTTPPRAVELPDGGRGWTVNGEDLIFPRFSPDGGCFVVPGPLGLELRATADPHRPVPVRHRTAHPGRPDFSPDGRLLAVVQTAPDHWEAVRGWINRRLGRPLLPAPEPANELAVFDTRTGAVVGHTPRLTTRAVLLGFAADGRSVWTMDYMPADGTQRVQQWPTRTGRPPAWVLAVTALGLLLLVADWRRGRRRLAGGAAE